MSKTSRTRELQELDRALRQTAGMHRDDALSSPSAEEPEPHAGVEAPEIVRLLRELKTSFSESLENTEGAVTEHPLAAVAAAFLLGVAVGRAMRRG